MQLEQYRSGRYSLSNTSAVTQGENMDSSAQNMSTSEDLQMCPLSACSRYTKRHTHNHRQLSETMSNTKLRVSEEESSNGQCTSVAQ